MGFPHFTIFLPPLLVTVGVVLFLAPPKFRFGIRNRYTLSDPYIWKVVHRGCGIAIAVVNLAIFFVAIAPGSRVGREVDIALFAIGVRNWNFVSIGFLVVILIAGCFWSRWLFHKKSGE